MDLQYKEVAGITNAVLPARSLDTMDPNVQVVLHISIDKRVR